MRGPRTKAEEESSEVSKAPNAKAKSKPKPEPKPKPKGQQPQQKQEQKKTKPPKPRRRLLPARPRWSSAARRSGANYDSRRKGRASPLPENEGGIFVVSSGRVSQVGDASDLPRRRKTNSGSGFGGSFGGSFGDFSVATAIAGNVTAGGARGGGNRAGGGGNRESGGAGSGAAANRTPAADDGAAGGGSGSGASVLAEAAGDSPSRWSVVAVAPTPGETSLRDSTSSLLAGSNNSIGSSINCGGSIRSTGNERSTQGSSDAQANDEGTKAVVAGTTLAVADDDVSAASTEPLSSDNDSDNEGAAANDDGSGKGSASEAMTSLYAGPTRGVCVDDTFSESTALPLSFSQDTNDMLQLPTKEDDGKEGVGASKTDVNASPLTTQEVVELFTTSRGVCVDDFSVASPELLSLSGDESEKKQLRSLNDKGGDDAATANDDDDDDDGEMASAATAPLTATTSRDSVAVSPLTTPKVGDEQLSSKNESATADDVVDAQGSEAEEAVELLSTTGGVYVDDSSLASRQQPQPRQPPPSQSEDDDNNELRSKDDKSVNDPAGADDIDSRGAASLLTTASGNTHQTASMELLSSPLNNNNNDDGDDGDGDGDCGGSSSVNNRDKEGGECEAEDAADESDRNGGDNDSKECRSSSRCSPETVISKEFRSGSRCSPETVISKASATKADEEEGSSSSSSAAPLTAEEEEVCVNDVSADSTEPLSSFDCEESGNDNGTEQEEQDEEEDAIEESKEGLIVLSSAPLSKHNSILILAPKPKDNSSTMLQHGEEGQGEEGVEMAFVASSSFDASDGGSRSGSGSGSDSSSGSNSKGSRASLLLNEDGEQTPFEFEAVLCASPSDAAAVTAAAAAIPSAAAQEDAREGIEVTRSTASREEEEEEGARPPSPPSSSSSSRPSSPSLPALSVRPCDDSGLCVASERNTSIYLQDSRVDDDDFQFDHRPSNDNEEDDDGLIPQFSSSIEEDTHSGHEDDDDGDDGDEDDETDDGTDEDDDNDVESDQEGPSLSAEDENTLQDSRAADENDDKDDDDDDDDNDGQSGRDGPSSTKEDDSVQGSSCVKDDDQKDNDVQSNHGKSTEDDTSIGNRFSF